MILVASFLKARLVTRPNLNELKKAEVAEVDVVHKI